MENIFDVLIKKIKDKGLPLCVGLDPHLDLIPEFIFEENFKKYGKNQNAIAQSVFDFNKVIIDNLKSYVPAFKPQIAFYEVLGIEGLSVLKKTLEYLRENNIITILDGKRNDIGSTSKAYANTFLSKYSFKDIHIDNFESDLLTVNGYLGEDGINPFLENAVKFDKGIFVLAKTSNKSAFQIQDLKCNGKRVYEYVADIVYNISKKYVGEYGFTNAGLVIGATYPETLKELREKYQNTFFLVPGFQSQGGDIGNLKFAFLHDRVGAIVNSSRGILYAYKKYNMKESDFINASIRAVEEAYEEFNKIYKTR